MQEATARLAELSQARDGSEGDLQQTQHRLRLAQGEAAAAQDLLAQLQASISETRTRMDEQAQGCGELGRQLQEGREQLRRARQEAEEAVAEAEDARKECGRVLRELAGVHEVGLSGNSLNARNRLTTFHEARDPIPMLPGPSWAFGMLRDSLFNQYPITNTNRSCRPLS